MAGRAHLTDAVLLRSVDFGEADRVVTLLTRDQGKVGALARGARRSRKRFGGALEPFCLLEVELGAGRGELDHLARATVQRPFPAILTRLDRMAAAGAAMELLREAVPDRVHDEAVFDATIAFLEALDGGGPPEELLLGFELHALGLLGFHPSLEACASCGREPGPGQAALFDPSRGAIVCRACGGASIYLSGESRAVMRRALAGELEVTAPWASETLREVRTALGRFVEHHLGKALAGGSVLAQMKRDPASGEEP